MPGWTPEHSGSRGQPWAAGTLWSLISSALSPFPWLPVLDGGWRGERAPGLRGHIARAPLPAGCVGPGTWRSHPGQTIRWCCRKAQRFPRRLGSNPRAQPQRRRREHRAGAGEPPPRAVCLHQGGKGKARSCPGCGQLAQGRDGTELWGSQLEERGKRCHGAAQGAPWGPNPPVQRVRQVSAQPGRVVPFVLLHLHPDGVELPLAPALRVRVRDGLDLPRGRGRALEGSPEVRRGGSASPMPLGQAGSWLPAPREGRSPPGRRWRDATSAAEPSSSAPPGQGWP